MFIGWIRCAAIPAYTGGKRAAEVSLVLLACGIAAGAVAALILLLRPPDPMAGTANLLVTISANTAFLVLATSKGLFGFALRRMAVFSGDAVVKRKAEMFLILQMGFVVLAILGTIFSLAGSETPALFVTLFLNAVWVVDLFVFLQVVNETRYLIR